MDAPDKLVHALRASLKETERLRQRNHELLAAANEPIAIVALACRLPAGVETPEQLWDVLANGQDLITKFPEDRGWPVAELHHPDPDRVGTYYARGGGFMTHPDQFDSSLFGISPREAEAMDPQQRVLLELAWETIERAGIAPDRLKGSATGVFVGVCYDDYQHLGPTAREATDGYNALGVAASVVSGRIAYTLGLEGPALTLDTACSTALVATHLACQALRRRECDLALSGGATIFSTLDAFLVFSRLRALSPDGRCRSFSDDADGAGWSEGAGLLLLERLSDAKANGHPILATIVGSAVNQDGRSQGLTAPNGPAQQRVIAAALGSAGLGPDDIDYVEAHGTGTPLGDPIEVQALQAAYGTARAPGHPLLIGSIKSNLGHTQAAAGVIGLIKLVLALEHQRLPKSLHAETLSTVVDWNEDQVRVLREPLDWKPNNRPRRAGVSSFGISGTNAHVIVEESPAIPDRLAHSDHRRSFPLLLSGPTAAALRAQAARLQVHLDNASNVELADVATTLAIGRTHFEHRACVIATDMPSAIERLTGVAAGQPGPGRIQGTADIHGKIAFVFPGQGAQWDGMGRGLLAESPAFAESIEHCAAALAPHTDWSLLAVLRGDRNAAALDRDEVVQPTLWAMMVALADLWRSYGVVPDFVVGHSQGEIAAATVAGALSLEQGAKLVALRSRLVRTLAGHGGMLAIALGVEQLDEYLLPLADRLTLAVDNGPGATVVSGDSQAIASCFDRLESRGVFARKVRVDYASHCAHVEMIRTPLLDGLAAFEPSRTTLSMLSTVDCRPVTGSDLGAEYWYRNLRQPVRFADSIRQLLDRRHRFFLEISPHPILSLALSEIFAASRIEAAAIPSLRRNEGALEQFELAVGDLHCRGGELDFTALFDRRTPAPSLPTYPFQRQSYWLRDARRQQPERPDVGSWLYAIEWEPLPDSDTHKAGERCLLVKTSDLGGANLYEDLRAAFDARGFDVRVLVIAEHSDLDIGESLMQATLSFAPTLIVSLCAVDERPYRTSKSLSIGFALNLEIARTLAHNHVSGRLWFVTRAAVATNDIEQVWPIRAMTSGLGRTFALEHPDRWGGCLDLESDSDTKLLARVPNILQRDDLEDQLALRKRGLLTRRLVRLVDKPLIPARKFGGTALITGGTGAVGSHVGRWLAAQGVEHIVLSSRRGPDSPESKALKAELEGLGSKVSILACDVSSHDSVVALLATIDTTCPPLSIVVHAAGVVGEFTPIAQLDLQSVEAILAAKVEGTRILDALTRTRPQVEFVLFSSISATWGASQQASYAAANAFLDAFAVDRVQRGLGTRSIAWGPWSGGGMIDGQARAFLARRGLSPMSPEFALDALSRVLLGSRPNSTVVDVDWPTFVASYAAARPRPLVSHFVQPERRETPDSESATRWLEGLWSSPEPDRLDRVIAVVRTEVARVLRLTPDQCPGLDQRFLEVGLDSLMAVELRNRLEPITGRTLPSTLVFEHPSTRALAAHLLSLLEPPSALDSVDHALELFHGHSTGHSNNKDTSNSSAPWLIELLHGALDRRAHHVVQSLVSELGRARALSRDRRAPTQAVCLSRPAVAPALSFYCIPSIASPSTHLQFVKLAVPLSSFGAAVWSADNPGYQPTDLPCRSIHEFIDSHRASLDALDRELPLVLLGYSAGAWLATQLAHALEHERRVAGLILLDPLLPPTSEALDGGMLSPYIGRNIDAFRRGSSVFTEEQLLAQLSSMASAFSAWSSWVVPPLTIPALYIRADRPSSVASGTITLTIHSDPRVDWSPRIPGLEIRTVTCDHFEMIADDAAQTSDIIRAWLHERLD